MINSNIIIKRAKFSSLTKIDLAESIENLVEPNINLSNAVKIKQ